MKRGVLAFAMILTSVLFFCGTNANKDYIFPDLHFFPKMPVSESNPVTVEGAALGRYLFYDPILSLDSTISCSSCHHQNSAFSDSPNSFSTGFHRERSNRNSMPLFNLAWYPSLFFDGRANTLEAQISHPITSKSEMNMNWSLVLKKLNSNVFYRIKFKTLYRTKTIDSVQVTNVIAQFLRTLISNHSKFDSVMIGKGKFTKDEYKGFVLMNNQLKGDCLHCHPTDGNGLTTTLKYSNNGLDPIYNSDDYNDKGRGAVTGNEKDNGKFMIPSLRNIALTSPYMHDGRFKTLEEVLNFYSSGVHMSVNIDSKMTYAYQKGVKLTEQEKHDIIMFLKTLTDSSFINDSQFSDPFKKQ